jgi:HlyD family secretion protein
MLSRRVLQSISGIALLTIASGCNFLPRNQAGAQPTANQQVSLTAVDVAIARTEALKAPQEFIGTTKPVKEVSLRAQVEGRILNINAKVGDVVTQGQILAQLDDAILLTNVIQAEAQVAALEAEVSRARTQVSTARAQAEQTRLQLEQAQRDSDRFSDLAKNGAISQQQAELSRTSLSTQQQLVNAAIARIGTEEEGVAAAIRRVEAQQAVVAQTRERQSLTLIPSPLDGVVLERISESGNVVQSGGEVLKLGDFSSIKVVTLISELELAQVQLGRSVQVRLDAFPNQNFTGQVSSISPTADPISRQIPIEVTIPNASRRITGGLLARVSFSADRSPRVVIPQSAIPELSDRRGSSGSSPSSNSPNRPSPSSGNNSSSPSNPSSPNSSPSPSPNSGARANSENNSSSNAGANRSPNNPASSPTSTPREVTLFVLVGEGQETKVQSRKVRVGNRADGKVEIISGLSTGEKYIVRSTKPLKDGESVKLSGISERS